MLENSAGLVLSNILLVWSVYAIYKPASQYPFVCPPNRHKWGLFFILVFWIFAFWGNDWFHLYESYDGIKGGERSHIEDVYVWLIENLPNYFIFRIVVWGGGLILLCKLFERIPVEKHLLFYVFSIAGVMWFSYARVSLSMTLMFLGLSVIANPYRKKVLSWIFGIALITVSYYFHKTALLGIVIVALAILTSVANRRVVPLILLLFPVFLFLIKDLFAEMMAVSVNSESSLDKALVSGQRYLSRDFVQSSMTKGLIDFFERTFYILTAYLSLRLHLSKKFETLPFVIKVFSKVSIYIALLSLLFSVDIGLNTSVLVERLFRFSFIPATIVLAYLLKNALYLKTTKLVLNTGIIMVAMQMLYALYVNRY